MKPFTIPLRLSNVFLLPCHDGYLQIDTGYEHDYALYRKKLSETGLTIKDIRYLLLTHHHDDHSGFLNEISRDGEFQIIAHKEAKDLLMTGSNDIAHGGGYINGFIKFAAGIKMRLNPRWTLSFPPFTLREQDILINDDDNQVLRRLGVAGRLLYTPGHCIDHLALVLDSGEAYCGDAAASFLLWAGTRYCTVFMSDMNKAYKSWQKILDAGARLIFPAHGHPFSAEKLRENMGKIKNEDLARFF